MRSRGWKTVMPALIALAAITSAAWIGITFLARFAELRADREG